MIRQLVNTIFPNQSKHIGYKHLRSDEVFSHMFLKTCQSLLKWADTATSWNANSSYFVFTSLLNSKGACTLNKSLLKRETFSVSKQPSLYSVHVVIMFVIQLSRSSHTVLWVMTSWFNSYRFAFCFCSVREHFNHQMAQNALD